MTPEVSVTTSDDQERVYLQDDGSLVLPARGNLEALRRRLAWALDEWILLFFPEVVRLGFSSPARQKIVEVFQNFEPYRDSPPGTPLHRRRPRRKTSATSIEAPRGQGKTTLAQLCLFWRALYGHERVIVWQSFTANDAYQASRNVNQLAARGSFEEEKGTSLMAQCRRLAKGAAREALVQRVQKGLPLLPEVEVERATPGEPTELAPIGARPKRDDVRDLEALSEEIAEVEQEAEQVRAALQITLRQLYPELKIDGSIGRWTITSRYGTCTLIWRGRMGAIRGLNEGYNRPTLWVGDDLNRDDRMGSLDQRDADWEYLQGTVANLGPPDGGLCRVLLGTRLHADALVARAAEHKGWTSFHFGEVIAWPDAPEKGERDLWADARAIWADLRIGSAEEREGAAYAFYLEHRARMDRGSIVLDPDNRPIFQCYLTRWISGDTAYWRERLNLAVAPTGQLLPMDAARRVRLVGHTIHWLKPDGSIDRTVDLTDCTLAIWHDPKHSDDLNSGDYAAVALVAKDQLGYRYVVRTDIDRAGVTAQRAIVWRLLDWLGVLGAKCRFGYETNGFQGWQEGDRGLMLELAERRAQGKVCPKIEGYATSKNKIERLAALEAEVRNHHVVFVLELDDRVWRQWVELPAGSNDDAPDAGERALWLLDQPSVGGGGLQSAMKMFSRRG
jgi:hypothetical protein